MNERIRELGRRIGQGYRALIMDSSEYQHLLEAKGRVEIAERRTEEALSASADLVSVALYGKIGVLGSHELPEGFVKGLNSILASERAGVLKENEDMRGKAKEAIATSENKIAQAREEAEKFVYGHVFQIVTEGLGAVSKRYAQTPLAVRLKDGLVYSSARIGQGSVTEKVLIRIAKSNMGRPLEVKLSSFDGREKFDVRLRQLGLDDEEFDLIYLVPESLNSRMKGAYRRLEEAFRKVASVVGEFDLAW